MEKESVKSTTEENNGANAEEALTLPKEIGAKENRPEPTRYGDWELNGKCVDF